ncbi:hypothetical protein ES708_15652 [subsurface metagenome]
MATVEITTKREQAAHFGLFRVSPGGNQAIFVRRKVGEPTDYMHTKSKKVKRQREVFAQASIHYSHLTGRQRHELKTHIEEVEYIRDHGKTDTKILQGRALFISKDIHSLAITHKPLALPGEICVVLADQFDTPIPGWIYLLYYTDGDQIYNYPDEISPSNHLFRDIPPAAHDIYFYAYSWYI